MAMDHTKFSKDGSQTSADSGSFDRRWWLCNKTEIAENVIRIANYLIKQDSQRLADYTKYSRLYSNFRGLGFSSQRLPNNLNNNQDRITYNGIQSGIDTVVAKMAKNKPKPLFLTSGGDYKIQRRAKELSKFCEGIFYENKSDQLGPEILTDAGVVGDGIVHVFDLHNRVTWERVLAEELFVDQFEGMHGDPRQIFRIKAIDRQVLLEMFPEKAAAIKRAAPVDTKYLGQVQNVSDLIMVAEAWHLKSGPDATDGMHALCIDGEGGLLNPQDLDYTHDVFPFAKLMWSKRRFGFWGEGGAEQVQGTQLEMNKILWVIQRSMKLMGSFKIWMGFDSKIVPEHFNNEIGSIIKGASEPKYLIPPIVQPEFYAHFMTLKGLLYERLGVSMLSAGSQKPEGLDSGKALREFNNIESDRFQVLGQKYEYFALDLAHLSILCAKDIAAKKENKGSYEVKVPGKKFIETIDWKDIDLEEDQFVMKVYPVSSLPQDPAGRLQTIQEYMQAGMLNLRQGRRLLDFPDLEQVEGLTNAQEDWIHQMLESIVDDGEYVAPDQYDDLQTCQELVLEYITQGKQAGLDVDKMNMLMTFDAQVKSLMQVAQSAMQPPQGQPGSGPAQAVPTAPPVSDMLPNAPGGAA